ncbi:MAG: hypothetical protein JWO34_2095 [Arthrobacter sp.]|nr:hypothetical protein [Arthrobacter sp.]
MEGRSTSPGLSAGNQASFGLNNGGIGPYARCRFQTFEGAAYKSWDSDRIGWRPRIRDIRSGVLAAVSGGRDDSEFPGPGCRAKAPSAGGRRKRFRTPAVSGRPHRDRHLQLVGAARWSGLQFSGRSFARVLVIHDFCSNAAPGSGRRPFLLPRKTAGEPGKSGWHHEPRRIVSSKAGEWSRAWCSCVFHPGSG